VSKCASRLSQRLAEAGSGRRLPTLHSDGKDDAFLPEQKKRVTLAGLEAVFIAHRAALLRFLRARGAGEDAEDLLQELWFRVRSAPIGPIGEPLPYLMRAANNLMLDRHRSRVRAQQRDRDWTDTAASGEGEAADTLDAERVLIGRSALAEAEEVLGALGSRVESIFRRFRLDGLTIDAVAREHGVSRSTAEKDLQKAYRALLDLRRRDDA
jgi:RNA polymerase sigma factor (sigma-70 family)